MKRILYWIYLFEWHISHNGPGFKGCSPVCYNEWIDYEFRDMINNPEYYETKWYYFMIDYIREKRSKGKW